MNEDATVHQRMVWLFQQVTGVDKRRVTAGGQNYSAFNIDDLYGYLHGKVAEAGLFVMPTLNSVEYVDREHVKKDRNGNERRSTAIDARVNVTYTFYAPDGTSVPMTVAAEGRDYQDKATNKAVQQAYKYGLVQALMIPTGEQDPDAQALEADAPAPSSHERAWSAVYRMAQNTGTDAHQLWWKAHDTTGIDTESPIALTETEADALIAAATEHVGTKAGRS